MVLLGQRARVHLRPSIHKVKEKAGGQKWLVALRGDSGTGQVENSPWLRTKTACRGGLGGACGHRGCQRGAPHNAAWGLFPPGPAAAIMGLESLKSHRVWVF